MKKNTSNIKFALQASPDSPESVLLAQQLGVEHLSMWSSAETYDEYKTIVDQATQAGLQIATCSSISNDERIVLALEGREEVIERYQNSLRAVAPAREPIGTATACPKRAACASAFIQKILPASRWVTSRA